MTSQTPTAAQQRGRYMVKSDYPGSDHMSTIRGPLQINYPDVSEVGALAENTNEV